MVAGDVLWLREPSRVAGLKRETARWMLALVAVAAITGGLLAGPATMLGDSDHASVVSAMRDGSDFYGLIGGIVPAGAFTGRLIPLPTLALVETVTGTLGTTILLCGVLSGILLVGWDRLGELFADRRGRVLGAIMLLGGAIGGALLTIAEPHGGWSALLTAWSLLLRRRGRWIEAAALACAAATIDPATLVLAAVMGGVAWVDGERRESAGWMIGILIAGITWAAHRVALAKLGLGAIGAGAPVVPFDFALAALLPGVAPWLAGGATVLALAGWTVVRRDLAHRVALVAVAGLVVAHVPGLQSAAVLTTVLLPLGLLFAIEAAALLLTAATSRRRITVKRVTR